jgi:hypothetical protein
MSKRKYSVINYIESENDSYSKGLIDGESIAKTFKKEPTFNFKSYLDGLCNGYTLEFKLLKVPDDNNNELFETPQPLINKVTLQTYINHEIESYNKGNKGGKLIANNNEIQFINFKSYLDGVCNGYTNYESKTTKSTGFFNFNSSDCIFRFPSSPHLTTLQLLEEP